MNTRRSHHSRRGPGPLSLAALALVLGAAPLLESCGGRQRRDRPTSRERNDGSRSSARGSDERGQHNERGRERAASGASSLESGDWELNVVGSDFDRRGIGKPRNLMSNLHVVLRVSDQGIVTIELIDNTRDTAYPITGYIREDVLQPGIFRLEATGKGESYEFHLSGEIRDSRFVQGVIVGVDFNDSSTGFEGRFDLAKTS